jgi:spore coat protein U domain-containing protein, fimbrial subunit CupE1/2/3/6
MNRNHFVLILKALLGVMLYLAFDARLVEAACSLTSTSMVFGTYDVLVTTPLDTTGSLIYRCSQRDHNIQITLDRGGAQSFETRRMVNGTEQLLYNLYLDAARTIIWGDGSGGTQVLFIGNPQSNNQDLSVPIFGRIPARQDRGIGTYTDTIIVTLNF